MKPQSRPASTYRSLKNKTSEEFNLVFHNNTLPMWVYDMQTLRFLDVNPAAVKLYGYSHAEFLKMRVSDITGEDNDPRQKTVRQTGNHNSGKIKHCRKNGSIIHVQISSKRITYNSHKAALIEIKNVVEKTHADQYFKRLLDDTPDSIVVINPSGKIILVNKQTEKLFGYTRDEILGKSMENLVPQQFRSRQRSHRLDYLTKPHVRQMRARLELRGLAKDGTEFPMEISLSPFQTEEGLLVMAAIRDITSHERAKAALHEAETKYRELIEKLPMIVYTNPARDISLTRYVSPQVEKILGYTQKEWLDDPKFWQKTIHPEDRQRVLAEVEHIDRTGEPFDMEYRVIGRDGRVVWFRDQAVLPRDPEGHRPSWQGLMIDITGKKQAEAALGQSENNYRDLIDHTQLLICAHDLQGKVLSINPWAAKVMGYEAKDLIGQNIRSVLAPETRNNFKRYLVNIRKHGAAQGVMQVITASGERRFWEYHSTLQTEGIAEPIVRGTAYDVTERKAAEKALGRSEGMYRGLFDNVLDGIFRTTPDGRLISANPALVHMLGYESEDDLLSIDVGSLYLDPQVRERNTRILKKTGEIRNAEIELKRSDGKLLAVLENSRAVRDSKGRMIFYEGTLTDITERKRTEEALRSSEGELRALFEAIPDLVLVLDKDGRYLKIAPTNPNSIPFPTESTLGRRMHEIFSHQKADELVGHIRKALRTNKPVQFEYAQLLGDRIIWFSGTAAPLTKETVVWVARDITPQKQAEERGQRRLVELEALYESGLVLSQTLDPRQIGEKVIRVLSEHLNLHHAAVRVRRGDSDEVELLAFSEMENQADLIEAGQTLARNAITKIGQGMAGWVMQHGRIINSGNLPDDPRYHKTFPNMLSGLYVPIRAGGRILGCISVEIDQHDAFNEADELLLTTLASQAAAALENARLFAETQQRAAESNSLYEAALDLTAQTDLSTLLQTLAERVASLLNIPGGGVYLYDPESDQLEIVSATHENLPIGTRLKMGEGMAGRVAEKREALIVEDYQNWDGRSSQYANQPFAAVLEVPMVYRGELIGVIVAYHLHSDNSSAGKESRRFTEGDLRLVSLFAANAAGAIYSARLFDATRKAAAKFSNLYKTAHDLSGQHNLDDLLSLIVERAGLLLNAPVSGIYLYDEVRNDLYVAVNRGLTTSLGVRLAMGEGVAGRVAQSQQPVIIEDYQVWEGRSPQYAGVPLRSILEVPMFYGGELIGVLTVDEIGDSERKFTQDDAGLLSLFASQAAAVVYSARLFEKISQRAGEFEAFYQTAADLSSQSDLPTLLNTIIQRAWVLTGAAGAGLYLFDHERGDLELVAIHDPDIQPGMRLDLGEGVSGRVAQTRQPLLVNNYQAWNGRSLKYEGIPHTSVIAVPMLYSGELIGVLVVFNRADQNTGGLPREFGEQDTTLISLFANAAAGAVYGARLLDQARRRVEELDAIARVSSALRRAATRAEMAPIILSQLREILQADGAAFLRLNPVTQEIDNELSQGSLEPLNGLTIPAVTGLSARVIQSRQVYSTPNLPDDPSAFSPHLLNNVRSAAIVPLVSQDFALGVLWVTRDEKEGLQPPAFDERDLRILSAIADITANAIHRVSLYEQTTHYAEQLVTINAMGHALSETLDLPGIYEKAARSALDLLPDTATVYISLFDPQTKLISAAYGLQDGDLIEGTALPALPFDKSGKGNQSEVILSAKPLIVPDLNGSLKDKRGGQVNSSDDERQTQSALYVPMKAEGRVIGVLQLESYTKNRYNSTDAELLELAANTAAGAIQNTRLFSQLKRRVDQLSALHAVDTAIGSSTDLRVSLQAVLENITRQLRVDAADVLLLNSSTLILQYTAGVGFLTSEIMRTSLSIGGGQAGKAALERRTVHVPDLNAENAGFLRSNLVAAERFVAYLAVPLIAKGEVKGVLEIFQRGPLDMDGERTSFLEMLVGQAALAIDNALMFESLERANVELIMAYDATIVGWSQALELRDQETQGHSARVLDLTLHLTAAMNLPDKETQDIRRGVLLHDIGKMGIPDAILHKPGPLTDEEWEIMRKHPQHAFDMLAPIVYLRNSLDIPYCHHEKWDGTGYPRQLKGETIPLAARIFSVVDVYDALTSDRPYRRAWSKEKTIEYIIEQSGKHFDPHIVDVFLKQLGA